MYEQDYIMRLIKEMLRAILKLIFNIEMENPVVEIFDNVQNQERLKVLINMIDDGNINEAENKVYEMIEDKLDLKTVLLFYMYLNEKDNDFLQANNYRRDEIEIAVKRIISTYELNDIADAFISDIE